MQPEVTELLTELLVQVDAGLNQESGAQGETKEKVFNNLDLKVAGVKGPARCETKLNE